MSDSTLIKLTDINFSYSGEKVLEHINLNIEKGEYLGIIGPNGGGKTTLLRIMLGLLRPQTGTVEMFGQPVDRFKAWSKIGYVPQRAGSFEPRFPITVEEVVSLGRTGRIGLFKRFKDADRQAVQSAMEKVDVWPLRHRLITELSGGQQQRVFIAKALASEPEILILDEPTVGVDLKSQDIFYQLLSTLNKTEKLTLALVSHDIDVVVNEATKLACINESMVYHGVPKEFLEKDYMINLYGKERKLILHGH